MTAITACLQEALAAGAGVPPRLRSIDIAMGRNVYGVRHNVVSVLVSEIDPELRQYPQSECIKDHG
jgi:hypothetical protein